MIGPASTYVLLHTQQANVMSQSTPKPHVCAFSQGNVFTAPQFILHSRRHAGNPDTALIIVVDITMFRPSFIVLVLSGGLQQDTYKGDSDALCSSVWGPSFPGATLWLPTTRLDTSLLLLTSVLVPVGFLAQGLPLLLLLPLVSWSQPPNTTCPS